MAVSDAAKQSLQDCVSLVEQGVSRFGSHEELARKMCHGRDNTALASRLRQIGAERAGEFGRASFDALKEQLETALK